MTLAMASVGRLKWYKVPFYWLAQYLGAFIGAACVYLLYYGTLIVADIGYFNAICLYERNS